MTPPAATEPPKPRATPLYEAHRRLGAKLIDFGGWMMPVSYPAGIVEEHKATRTAVGIFDVSHMGEVHFRGSGAAAAVQRLVTNDVGQLTDGRAMYTVACRPDGGIVDDLDRLPTGGRSLPAGGERQHHRQGSAPGSGSRWANPGGL